MVDDALVATDQRPAKAFAIDPRRLPQDRRITERCRKTVIVRQRASSAGASRRGEAGTRSAELRALPVAMLKSSDRARAGLRIIGKSLKEALIALAGPSRPSDRDLPLRKLLLLLTFPDLASLVAIARRSPGSRPEGHAKRGPGPG
jgi:hypothetical protein